MAVGNGADVTLLNRIHKTLSPLIYGDRLALVPPSVNANWPRRQCLRSLLTRLEVDCVFDVGANIGQYAKELRLIGYRGPIVSFEPSKHAFETLSRYAAADPLWHPVNIALGDVPGVAEINEMRASVFNSFLAPTVEQTDQYSADNVVERTAEVRIDTLSNIFPDMKRRFSFKRPFLKMDTQGFDLRVFRGAAAVRDQIVAMQSELSIKHIYADSPRWMDAIAEYEAGGFDLLNMYKVNPGDPLMFESDCFFARRALPA